MSAQVFDFADTSRVAEELAPQEAPVITMNGWPFTVKPKTPYQREFRVKLYGVRWYLDVGGTALDITTNSKMNAGRLLKFYRDHRLWDSFLYNHEYLGVIRVRFNKALTVPAGAEGAGGKIPVIEVDLIEHSPSY